MHKHLHMPLTTVDASNFGWLVYLVIVVYGCSILDVHLL